jgi:hypothetical protein
MRFPILAALLSLAVMALVSQAQAEQPAVNTGARPAASLPPVPMPRPADVFSVFEKFGTAKPVRQNAPPRAKGVPDDYKLAMLIRTSLIALNQANITGNYSVLRDLAAPSFSEANNPARLAELFANLRARNIDLEPILVVDPKVAEPFINERGMLRIKGIFPTAPEQVNFELAFEPVGTQWRLFGISVTTSPVGPLAQTPAPKNPAAPATVAQ